MGYSRNDASVRLQHFADDGGGGHAMLVAVIDHLLRHRRGRDQQAAGGLGVVEKFEADGQFAFLGKLSET